MGLSRSTNGAAPTTDRDVLKQLADAVDDGRPVALATVVATRRSVPRHAGAKMLVFADGRQIGTVGGGELEWRVVAACEQALRTGRPATIEVELIDPARGDAGVCGGEVSVYVEPFMPQSHVVVIGCGHVGVAVVELAHWLGHRVTAIDDRDDLAVPGRMPDADAVLGGPFAESVTKAAIDEHTDVVLVTRGVDVDAEVLPLVLESQARSIGVMGSARRWATTRDRLRAAGVSDDRLDRVVSPVGLDIGAETPAEIAVSIMSELVAARQAEPPYDPGGG